ncbi:MAG: GDP-mannose 4,6-dehydratase [Melioribacteraceae bacterium]|nr:GDP-mannose 4,6-dehydratase [Melioribacteraceae bacterium]
MKEYYYNKNVLITGGLGFIGSSLANRLVELGANVTIIDNMEPLYGGNYFNIREIESKLKVIIADVRNTSVIQPLIEKSHCIFHLAAQISYIDSLNIPFEDLDLNSRATLNLLELCRKYNPEVRILFSSSRMVYGKVEKPIVTENCDTNPLSLYGIHKLTSEKYLLMYYKDFGIPSTILRITNPYGPRQQIKHSKYSLVGWFIRQAMENKVIKIYGEGRQLRDYIFIDDIIEAMLRVGASADAVGEVLNVGSGISTKFADMVKLVLECVKSGDMEFISWPKDYEKVETGDIAVDISKLQKVTLWKPDHSLEDGINLTYQYYKKNIHHYI